MIVTHIFKTDWTLFNPRKKYYTFRMNYTRNSLAIFFSYYKPHWTLFVGDIFCATVYAAIDILFPMASRWAIDAIIPQKNFKLFFILIAAILVAFLLKSACNYFITYWGHIFGTRVEADMRRDVFAQIERQSFSFFDKNRTGKLMSRVTTDLFDITELAHHGPEDVWISLLTILGASVMLLKIRWELAVIVFIFLPATIFVTSLAQKRMLSTSKKVKESTSEINAAIESSISGIRVTKVFGNEKFEEEKFNKGNSEYKLAKRMYYKEMSRFHTKIELFSNILSLIVLCAGGFFIMKGSMKVSDLVAANLFVAAFTSPVRRLSFFMEQFTTGMAGFNRFLEIMKTDTAIHETSGAKEIFCARGNIRYEDVSFSYNGSKEVLSHINLDIKPGQKYALVGLSGGGKTTIANLLPRFYEITSGNIFLDGIDIKDITVPSLRKQIGIVQQDVFLFAGTIKENIAYGKITATNEEIEQAARRTKIHDDIMKMPFGYDTIVGERGVLLSGGQKQRISIARCFLKNPPILILDEATSALDSATELQIQAAFDSLSKGRTTIVIAHRLSTICNADCIAVVGESGIIEQGTHQELIALNGEYAQLYKVQNATQSI